jgi:2-dehydropantoate 2-reductase
LNVLVVGAGATGGYFGARLAQAGRDVSFLLRPARAAQVRGGGLRLTGQGPDEVVPVRAVTADQMDHAYDIVLLTVKNQALAAALEDLEPAVGPGTLIVPFQNGMSHLDRLNERFGQPAVLGGVVKVATTLDERGSIVRLAPWASLTIGAQTTAQPVELTEVADVLDVDGYDMAVSADIVTDMWAKWSFIATVGALTCLLRGTIGEIVAVPGGRDVAFAALDETVATSAACGFPVPAADIEATTAMITLAGSPLASSMYRDLTAGLATEVEFILADLADRARAHGVDTPVLRLATAQLRIYERRRLSERPTVEA